jgi:hypothetical protein
VLSSPDEFTLEHPWKDDKPKQHQFDHVFDQFATQEQIFDDTKVVSCNFLICCYCIVSLCHFLFSSSPEQQSLLC